jgi:transcriptional regulator with XRE-family HTH domain
MNTPPQIAELIESMAKNKKISVAKILRECNLGKNTIDNMKDGKQPAADKIATLAEYLGISADYLLGNNPIPQEKIDFLDRIGYAFSGGPDKELTAEDVDDVIEILEMARELRKKRNKN